MRSPPSTPSSPQVARIASDAAARQNPIRSAPRPTTDNTVATRPGLALGVTLAVQAVSTVCMTAPSVMAPVVAPLLGLPAQRIGWFVGLAYCAAMFSGLFSGARVHRSGAVTMNRWALYAAGLGLVLAGLASLPGLWPLLFLAAVSLGIGYGLPNPAASLILARHAPVARRGLFFSLKQTGVPIGIGVSGLLVPLLMAVLPWPIALGVLAALSAGLALLLRAARALDAESESAQPGAAVAASPTAVPLVPLNQRIWQAFAGPLRQVWGDPAVRRLGMASIAFSITQICFITFLVSYLKLEHGLSLAVAAGILSASQVLSVIFRVVWGQMSDHVMAPTTLLGLLGIAMGLAAAGLGSLPADAPYWLMTAAAMACGATSMAWNGVFFADLARRVAPSRMATVTGGTQFLTFCGAMFGPVVFASLVSLLGGHGPTYLLLAVIPFGMGVHLLTASLADARRARSS